MAANTKRAVRQGQAGRANAPMRWLMSPALLRPACALLRHLPMLRLKRGLWVTRHADVVEVLTRDDDFGVDPAMAERFEQVIGPFLLGMDRSSAYEAQASLLRRVVRPNDLPRIRELVANHVTEVMSEAWSGGRIDVVWLARMVSVRLMGSYLGVPGPDDATMLGWVRTLFGYAFFARSAEEAMGSAGELRDYLQGLLTQRRATMAAGAHGYRGQHDDDVLTRLLELQRGDPSLEDNILRCNLAGLAVAAVEQCAKAIVYVTDELLGRPTAHAEAREAALAGDMATLKRYVFEAMRFRPNNPTVPPRFCKRETTVAEGTRWEQRIPAGRRLVVFTFSAMFDKDAFHEPDHFRTDRPLERYLQFGHGLHTCFGRQIVAAVVPDVIAALLCLPGLRRAPGREGRITYDGFSPIRLILESDEPVSCSVRAKDGACPVGV